MNHATRITTKPPSVAPSTLATLWPPLASDCQSKPCLSPAGCGVVAAAASGVSASV